MGLDAAGQAHVRVAETDGIDGGGECLLCSVAQMREHRDTWMQFQCGVVVTRRIEFDDPDGGIVAKGALIGRAKTFADLFDSLLVEAHTSTDSTRFFKSSSAACRILASARRFTNPGSGTSMSIDT